MSLVFLKSQNRAAVAGLANPNKPYRFSNYFPTPLHLEPNSQVALVNSQFFATEGDQIEGDNAIEIRVGNEYMNPILVYPLKDRNVENWAQEFNDIAKTYNMLSNDGNFNHVLERTLTPGAVGTSSFDPQQVFDTGLNLWYSQDNKVYGRLVQRSTNVVYNQAFNCLGLNQEDYNADPLGIGPISFGIRQGAGDDAVDFINLGDIGCIKLDGGTILFLSNPQGVNPNLTGGGISSNESSFYNTQWARSELLNGAFFLDYNIPLNSPPAIFNSNGATNAEVAFNNPNSSYCGILYNACIKQYVGDFGVPPSADLNGGGHNFPSTSTSGGYAVMTQDMTDHGRAIQYVDAGSVGATFAGRIGLTASSFGVHSYEFINSGFDDDPVVSRSLFMENCDLNTSISATTPEGSNARYLMGVRYVWEDVLSGAAELFAVVEILKPDTPYNYSEYEEVAKISINQLCEGSNTATTPPTAFGGGTKYAINVHNHPTDTPAQLIWRFRWISPYQMNVEFCFRLSDPASYNTRTDEPYLVGGTDDPTSDWCVAYTMDKGADGTTGDSYYFPSYNGGLCLIVYPTLENQGSYSKGFYDIRQQYRKYLSGVEGLGNGANFPVDLTTVKTYDDLDYWDNSVFVFDVNGTMRKSVGAGGSPKIENLTPEKFDSSGRAKKEIHMLMAPMKTLGETDEWLNFGTIDNALVKYQVGEPVGYKFGYDTGIINGSADSILKWNSDILGGGAPYQLYGFNPSSAIRINGSGMTLHFQLNNLPVKSQNGVVASTNKTIAVVNTLCEGSVTDEKNAGWYCYEPNERLFIDLNNYGPLDLNTLDILVTRDNNIEAKDSLGYETDVTLCFRQKPNNQGYKQFQGQTQPTQLDPNNPYFQSVR